MLFLVGAHTNYWIRKTSKTLNYLDSPMTAPYFTLFMCVWIYLRHYVNLVILYATFTSFRTVGPFELNWDTQQYKCWISQYIAFVLLGSLQCLNIFWLYFVLRIAYNITFRKLVEDVRSDDEDTEEEDDDIAEKIKIGGRKGNEGAKDRINGSANGLGITTNGHAPEPKDDDRAIASERKKER